LAFYLPQYHTFPENDAWWGRGFTEWTNVVKEKPRFSGHKQPQMPADLGFYDLRVEDTRLKQAEMARKHGVDGFVYYHYWFGGKRIMNEPFDLMRSNPREDFPFSLCWANETWTRAWDGQERNILIEQTYSESDDDKHIEFLLEAFADDRYIKIDGKPLFSIYRIGSHPEPGRFIDKLRARSAERSYGGVYLCGVKSSFSSEVNEKILSLDLDAFIDFQPNSEDFPTSSGLKTNFYTWLKKILPNNLYQIIKTNASANKRIDYESFVDQKCLKDLDYFKRVYPCVFPSWDNSARRKTATIIQNSDVKNFGKWLRHALTCVAKNPESEQIVFINAWNEWAEGCHLEPDVFDGHGYLECVKEIVERS
jgi:hypothetical protein